MSIAHILPQFWPWLEGRTSWTIKSEASGDARYLVRVALAKAKALLWLAAFVLLNGGQGLSRDRRGQCG